MKRKMIKRNVSKALSVFAALAMGTTVLGTMPAFAYVEDLRTEHNGIFVSEYASFEEVLQAGEDLNLDLAAEGFVLLKNEANALPLANAANVTVIGSAANDMALGGGGSGAQGRPGGNGSSVATAQASNVYDALEGAGFNVNPTVAARYGIGDATRSAGGAWETGTYMEIGDASAAGAVEFAGNYYVDMAEGGTLSGTESSFTTYGDAAVVVIARSGTEFVDANTHTDDGHTDPNDSYFSLEDAEKEMIALAKKNFDKVILVINSPSVVELADVQNDDAIQAVVWVGQPGWNGILALGDILNGTVNPSGRLVDQWMADFTTDPTWYNFGNYTQANYALNGEYGDNDSTVQLNPVDGSTVVSNSIAAIDYAEGIYVGYRYYETVAQDIGGTDGEEWYDANTVYSFGHGLSYTTFTQEMGEITGDLADADGTFTVPVTVTNTGDVAGKEVVQLYVSKPYTEGGIEKAAIDLVGFAKTDVLAPDASETVNITVKVKDLASFDYDDRNDNDFNGYELEAGDYVLSIRANSHDVLDTDTLTAATALTWDEDGNPETPNNIFSQPLDSKWGQFNTHAHAWTTAEEDHYLSRVDLVANGEAADLVEQLTWLLTDENEFKDELFTLYNGGNTATLADDYDNAQTPAVETNYENLWVKTDADIPAGWTQGAGVADANGNYPITLWDMQGIALSDTEAWDEFMNQLTYDEIIALITSGGYQTPEVDSVNKPYQSDQDGPGQLVDGWAWVCEVVIASTWNVELAYEQGVIVGEESIWQGTNGWYGPAANNHRNPHSGRNFEYYSQDGLHGGKIAAAVCSGATSAGCHVYLKHSFLNDQETNRMGTITFATEQAIREIYAKPFEIATREGDVNGYMNAFNRIGVDSSINYAITIQMYENEWGFDGYSVTDFYSRSPGGWTSWGMARGMTQPLGTADDRSAAYVGTWSADANCVVYGDNNTESPTQWYWARTLATRIMFTTVNSNAMINGLVDISLSSDAELVAYEAVAANTSVLNAASVDALDEFFGEGNYSVSYRISGVSGVTVSAEGILSGTPAQTIGAPIAGTNATVSVTVTGTAGENEGSFNTFSVVLPIVQGDTYAVGLSTYGAYGAPVNQYAGNVVFTQFTLVEGENYIPGGAANSQNRNRVTAVAYAAENLPDGWTIDAATGAIRGDVEGTDPIEFTVSATISVVVQSGKNYRTNDFTYTAPVVVEVTDELPDLFVFNGEIWVNGESTGFPVGIADATINSDGELVITYSNGTTENLGVVVGANGANGTNGTNGANGAPGADGKSAYEIAVENGFEGTEEEWLESLVGADGAPGATGPQGPKGDKGDAAEGGCAGSIAGTAIASLAAMAVVGGALVARKRK